MGTTAAESGRLQPAGGDEVPLQMTADYDGDSCGDLRRFATICDNLPRFATIGTVEAAEGGVGCSVVVFLMFRRFATIEPAEGGGSGGGSLF